MTSSVVDDSVETKRAFPEPGNARFALDEWMQRNDTDRTKFQRTK